MEKETIKSFTQLIAWQEGHRLVLQIYKNTKLFPKEEIYSLVSQMRRCVVSITSNIAEGFSRRTKKDKINFYHTSLGSLTELQNQLIVARDVGYLNEEEFIKIANQTVTTSKLINGLIKSARIKKLTYNALLSTLIVSIFGTIIINILNT